jgi:Cu(I)/Ag(I) efflux system membrane fusion protein
MKAKTLVVALVVALLAGGGGYAAYRLGMNRGMHMAGPADSTQTTARPQRAGDVDPGTGKKVLYWHDPMVPGQRFDKPGKSPFMDMQLVPVYEGGASQEGAVAIDPRVQQNLGIRTAEVRPVALTTGIEVVGSVAYNERDVAVVQARVNGYVERLLVRAPLDPVRKGQALAELYAPDWVAAQEEYLSVKRMPGGGLEGLLDAARQRMRLAGMTEDQIRLVESSGKVHARLVVTAPLGGVISELNAREGMTVMSGAPLFRINGLGTVWVNAEVPESQASLVRPGVAVEARAVALTGTALKGRVNALLPDVNPTTRTLKARIELPNPGNRLVPGMFVTVSFAPESRQEVLSVPTEAVIRTGTRSVVIVAQGEGKFSVVDVEVGMESNGQSEVRKGLQAGQKVVVSGQFLLDSEANLRGSTARMSEMPGAPATPAAPASKGGQTNHRGTGTVTEIDAAKGHVQLDHGAIPSMSWPAMQMGFAVSDKAVLARLKKGDKVEFEVRGKPNPQGDYVIEKIEPAGNKP